MPSAASLDLFWIPLGAGARVVRFSGRLYETASALVQRRERYDLYHAALVASFPDRQITIEVAPVPDDRGPVQRGVVGEGPVGLQWLGRFRLFRYEVRCWANGVIPDLRFAVASPVRIADDTSTIERVLASLSLVPTPTWGRDEIGAGDMWNSNSVVSWTLSRAGLVEAAGAPPAGGRAPGWRAGLVAAGAAPA